MKNQRNFISIICFLCICTMTCLNYHHVTAANTVSTDQTITIGYIDYDRFIDEAEDGTYSGYGIDYLNEISKYTGWNYKFVYDTWDNQMQNLKSGKIDFVCLAQKTTEREKDYLFSKYSDGSESSILYVQKDDKKYYYNDFENFNGMKIALLKNSFQNSEFTEYAKRHYFTYIEKNYATSSECFEALQKGEVDGVATGSLAMKKDYKMVCRFGSDPFYFMSGQHNKQQIEQLDDAMGQINAVNPYFTADLNAKYYGADSFSSLLLTREESEYIQTNPDITVGIMDNRKPLSYKDEDGQAAGMTVDLMNLIAQKAGFHFKYEFLSTGQTGMDYLTHSDGKLVAGVMSSVFSMLNPDLLQSDTLQEGSVVFVGRKGTRFAPDAPLTVALPKAFIGGEKIIQKQYPNFVCYQGKDDADCLNAIRRGIADIMFQNLYIVRNSLQSPKYESLEMFSAYSFTEDMKVVCQQENTCIMSIINKTIASLTDDEKNEIVLKNTIAQTYTPTLSDIVYKYRYPVAILLVLLLACICLFIIILVTRQHNLSQLREKNYQLGEAVAQADNANLAKSQFLARMSHEIRTPMNAIVGITTLAKHHKEEPERVEEYLDKIDVSSHVLLNIINDVLDMSAIESDKIKIGSNPFNVRDILTSISTIYYPQCKDKGIDFSMNTSDIVHENLLGDGLRINQVLLNLISNAYKFTPEGGRITIVAKEASNRDGIAYFKFSVEDTGEGMTEEMQQRLFKPFEQEVASIAQKHGGSGLGLSIAKNLVEMMHGSISCQSEKDKGTTFFVLLPFEIDQEVATTEDKKLKTLQALIVDDEQDTREYVSIILDRIGVPYQIASGGQDALNKLKQADDQGTPYDVCLLDWKMPDVDGEHVTRQIRNQYNKNTLVIVVSAYDTTEVKEQALNAGANMFLTKPLFQSTVFNLFMKLSGGQYVHKEAEVENYDFQGRKVLLAEDTEFNAEIAIELLELVNIKVDHAKDGKEAVDLFRASQPGEYFAILMDVQMPELDGYEATKVIRNLDVPEAKTIQIIAMTANAFTEDVSNALNAGMNGHIAKPIDTNILYKTLYKIANP